MSHIIWKELVPEKYMQTKMYGNNEFSFSLFCEVNSMISQGKEAFVLSLGMAPL